jgi:hypothetical protein
MKLFSIRIAFIAIAAMSLMLESCDKTKPYDIAVASPVVHFDGPENQAYAVRTAVVDPFEIEVGTSDVTSTDRTVSFTVTSTTGAAAGIQYSVVNTGNTVTIPAGKAIATISIQGIFAGYPTGRVDTLIIALTEPSIKVAGFSDTVRLAIGDICAEGVGFNINDFMGNYANTNEVFGGPYGPYTTAITNITSTGPTSATITVANIWDNGWDPILFDLDWSDPTNLTADVQPQAAIGNSNAGDINPAYAGQTIAVRASATGGPGTFSTCNNTLILRMQLGVTGLGFFAPVYTVNMAR